MVVIATEPNKGGELQFKITTWVQIEKVKDG